MILLTCDSPTDRRRHVLFAFTLIELLASMALVALVMLAVAQMMNSTRLVTGASGRRMDADAEVRTVFDRMAGDFARMVKRADVDYYVLKQVSNDAIYFYSAAPAYASEKSAAYADQNPVALVGYRINAAGQLERLGKGLAWSEVLFLAFADSRVTTASVPDPASTIPVAFKTELPPDPAHAENATVLGENVFRLEFTFLLKPCKQADGIFLPALYSNDPWDTRAGHTSLNSIGFSDVQAVVVTLGIMDSATRKILPAGADFSKAAETLKDDNVLPKLPAQVWQEAINAGNFTITGFPASAANQVRIYQRIFPLNTP